MTFILELVADELKILCSLVAEEYHKTVSGNQNIVTEVKAAYLSILLDRIIKTGLRKPTEE